MDRTTAIANDAYDLYVGVVLDTDNQAKEYVQQYAIQHNFAVKNGHVSNKQKTLLLVCKCANKYDPGKIPLEKGVLGDNGLIRLKRQVRCSVNVHGGFVLKSSISIRGSSES
ncbi:hypothetical protein V1506DRAFT_549746 [Lipomyces tetrasporus]